MSAPRKTPTAAPKLAPPPADDEDRYSITRVDGFLRYAEGPRRTMPPRYTRQETAGLSGRELARYQASVKVWHANIGPLETPQLTALHEALWEIVDSNHQDGDKQKPAALVDAYPGLGKTTAVLAFARDYHHKQIEELGAFTAEGHRRIPVAYIDLSGSTQIRGLNEALCRFYNLPCGGNADRLAERAKDACLSLDTRVFVVDDLHFLAPVKANERSVRMGNQLKHLANTFPVTLIYAGVEVMRRKIPGDGDSQKALYDQFGRRTTALTMHPFRIEDDAGRVEWIRLLKSIERQLVLPGKYPGMLARDLADYLYARSTGHFQSLMELINRGCRRAVVTGHEVLDVELMDKVNNDSAAEEARREIEAKLVEGLISAHPAQAGGRR